MDPILTGILFVFGFSAAYRLSMFTLARFGGWNTLATRFKTEAPPRGESKNFNSLSISHGDKIKFFSTNYGGCIVIIDSPQGLFIRLWRILAAHHPQLLIPWEKIELREQRSKWRRSDLDIYIPDVDVALSLTGQGAKEARKNLGRYK